MPDSDEIKDTMNLYDTMYGMDRSVPDDPEEAEKKQQAMNDIANMNVTAARHGLPMINMRDVWPPKDDHGE